MAVMAEGRHYGWESADGLDVMMLAAEQMNIPLTAIWHAVRMVR